MLAVSALARLLPERMDTLELIFLIGLAIMTALVGLFALYVVGQQFRNPGRTKRD
jgi:low temperature requirement protein LtrA